MLGTGFEHKNAALFFDNVGWNFLQAFWAYGCRRFNDAVKSKIRPRELAIWRREVYKFSGIVQFNSRMNAVNKYPESPDFGVRQWPESWRIQLLQN